MLLGRVAALLGVAGRRVALLGWVAGLFRRVAAALVRRTLRLRATARVVLGTPVALVVVLVAGPSRPLSPAVARIVSHWCYSSFFAERVI